MDESRVIASEGQALILFRMSVRERPADRGRRVARLAIARVFEEARLARIAAGLSQRDVGRAIGRSHTWVGGVEGGRSTGVGFEDLGALLASVGLEPRLSVVPGPDAHRDAAHASLLERTRSLIHESWAWRLEVPLPNPGDSRAWDALARGDDVRIGFEAETGPRDGQALQRRLALKRRDGGVDHVILVLSDTQRNRHFLRDYAAALRIDFPLTHRAVAASLRVGRDPGGSGILVL